MCIDVERLVHQVKPILFPIVAEDVVLLVSVAELHDPASNQVTDTTSCIYEREAIIGDPEARVDHVCVFVYKLEGFFKTIFVLLALTLGDRLVDCYLIVSEQVESVFKSKNYHLSVFRPEDVLQILGEVYPSDDAEGFPVIESDKVFASDPE